MATATTEQDRLLSEVVLPSSIGLAYGEEVFGEPYVLYPWIKLMEERIVEAILDDTHERYLIINAPPQTGKSSYVGLLLPFWYTGHFTSKSVMYLAYSDEFAETKGQDVQDLHRRYGRRLFGTSISAKFAKMSEWRISGKRGGMLSSGLGGKITGKPAHLIILDDLIKNDEDAQSDATKKRHLREWDGTIHSRLQPGGTVIIIATRWAEDDLTGQLKARMAEPGYDGPQWEVLEFPVFAEMPDDDIELTEDEAEQWRDILGRLEGEVLDCRFSRIPGREPDDYYLRKRAGTDPLTWSCLYQQRPTSIEGSMFPPEHWRFYDTDDKPDRFEAEVRVWDLAATAGGGDWTVGARLGRYRGQYFVTDIQRFRRSSGDVLNAVEHAAKVDGWHVPIMVEQEKGGSGPTVTAAIRAMLVGWQVNPAKAEGDKKSRAMPYSGAQQQNKVYLPQPGTVPWDVREFIREHSKMMSDGRKPKHDDQIDTCAYGIMALLGSGGSELQIPGEDFEVDGFADARDMGELIEEWLVQH